VKIFIRKLLVVLLALFLFAGCDLLSDDSGDDDGGDFVSDYAQGIKDALTEGIKRTCSTLGAQDGYYANTLLKILLPTDVQTTITTITGNWAIKTAINQVVLPAVVYKSQDGKNDIAGFENDIVLAMNRAAERAAGFEDTATRSGVIKGTFTIFAEAITKLTINDSIEILKGYVPGSTSSDNGDTARADAATEYLKLQTYDSLKTLFKSVIDTVLDEGLISINNTLYSVNQIWKYYYDAINYYNQNKTSTIITIISFGYSFPTLTTPPASLSDHVTTKALDGLFLSIADAEKAIRSNPVFDGATDFLIDAFEYARDTLGAIFG